VCGSEGRVGLHRGLGDFQQVRIRKYLPRLCRGVFPPDPQYWIQKWFVCLIFRAFLHLSTLDHVTCCVASSSSGSGSWAGFNGLPITSPHDRIARMSPPCQCVGLTLSGGMYVFTCESLGVQVDWKVHSNRCLPPARHLSCQTLAGLDCSRYDGSIYQHQPPCRPGKVDPTSNTNGSRRSSRVSPVCGCADVTRFQPTGSPHAVE
jgi:hypothetical protein